MEEIARIASVIFVSSVKFLIGIPLAKLNNFDSIQSLILTATGGVLGVIVFSFLSDRILHLWNRFLALRMSKKKRELKLSANNSGDKKTRSIFNSRNRLIVRVTRQYGLFGIIALTPPVLSIPLGTFLAIRFSSKRRSKMAKKKVVGYLLVSVLAWSVILSAFFFIF